MYIVFCHEISSMGKKFEDNPTGMHEMGCYIALCLRLHPKAEVKVQRYI